MAKKVIISVTSDLATDQRVHRTAMTLHKKGLEVVLAGRRRRRSMEVKREYKTVRFRFKFEKGPLFYAAFNIRLFIYLLFSRADALIANDLDTLLANGLVARLKRIRLYYDSHEYFTEVPELVSRPVVQRIWKWLERRLFYIPDRIYTVNESIAGLYGSEYGRQVSVIRNVPVTLTSYPKKTRQELGLPVDKKILLFQGAGINIDRGGEEAVQAMQYLDGFLLLFIGGGDVIEVLKKMAVNTGVQERVRFIPGLPLEELRSYTGVADIGLTLDKDTNLNYRFSLPNKLFDYIHAELPVLASDLPEVRKIVEGYDIGLVTRSHNPKELAETIKEMVADEKRFGRWKENLKLAAAELCWEKEERKLLDIVHDIL